MHLMHARYIIATLILLLMVGCHSANTVHDGIAGQWSPAGSDDIYTFSAGGDYQQTSVHGNWAGTWRAIDGHRLIFVIDDVEIQSDYTLNQSRQKLEIISYMKPDEPRKLELFRVQ